MGRHYLSHVRLSFWAIGLTCAFLFVLSSSAFANTPPDCSNGADNLNHIPTCAYVPNQQIVTVAPKAFNFNGSEAKCEQITNSCGSEILVPTGLETEWTSFLGSDLVNASSHCVSLAPCSLQINLQASTTNILAGSSVNLSWTIAQAIGAVSCTASSTDSPSTWSSTYSYAASAVPTTTAATATVTPTSNTSTTYTLACIDSANNSGSNSVKITVGQPLTVSLTANPTTVQSGNTTTINYNVTDSSGLAFTCAASNTDNDNIWTSSQYVVSSTTLNGSTIVTPAPIGTDTSVTYTLTCTDSLQANVQGNVTVSVGANSCPAVNYLTWGNGSSSGNCSGGPLPESPINTIITISDTSSYDSYTGNYASGETATCGSNGTWTYSNQVCACYVFEPTNWSEAADHDPVPGPRGSQMGCGQGWCSGEGCVKAHYFTGTEVITDRCDTDYTATFVCGVAGGNNPAATYICPPAHYRDTLNGVCP